MAGLFLLSGDLRDLGDFFLGEGDRFLSPLSRDFDLLRLLLPSGVFLLRRGDGDLFRGLFSGVLFRDLSDEMSIFKDLSSE